MNETPYVIKRTEGRWAIQFCGRVFDRFEDKDDAVLTAVIQAEGARRQGRLVRVLVEENGRARAVWGEDAGACARPGSGFQGRPRQAVPAFPDLPC
jgi:hypothetical protein